jgi:PTH1 family peptidyl-tRNA hydrolase
LWIIVGLGNPGSKYVRTRHNIGFAVLDQFAGDHNLEFKEKTDLRICSGSIGTDKIVLMEPLTFMNRSGTPVKKVMDKYPVTPDNLIVVQDDLDIEPGRLKIRKKGSAGGHNGIASIIQTIGTNEFIRVKIGIGREPGMPTDGYVLSKFKKEEQPLIKEAVTTAVDAIHCIITEGIDRAMNRFN